MYKTFGITLFISFVIMYAIMFLNANSISHVYLSATRLYMTLLMVSSMAVLMLVMMKHMYKNKKLNSIIMISGIVVFIVSLFFLRSQTFVGDRQYMKAMIPHHSSAIMTSEHAAITDPELRKLADDIIKAQEKEIAQMKAILQRLK